jgi:CBS-domain-containing membrane protein
MRSAHLRPALLRTSQHEFPVLDATGRVLGVLTRDPRIAALKRQGPAMPVVNVMRRELPVVRPNDPFEKALCQMQACGCPALPVVDRAGRLLGLVTPENVGEMMLVHSVRPRTGRPAWRSPHGAI